MPRKNNIKNGEDTAWRSLLCHKSSGNLFLYPADSAKRKRRSATAGGSERTHLHCQGSPGSACKAFPASALCPSAPGLTPYGKSRSAPAIRHTEGRRSGSAARRSRGGSGGLSRPVGESFPPPMGHGARPHIAFPKQLPFHHNTTEHEAAPHSRSGTMGVRGRLSPPAGFRGSAPVPFLPFLPFLSSAITPFRSGRRLRTRTGRRVWRRGRAAPRGGGIRRPFWR